MGMGFRIEMDDFGAGYSSLNMIAAKDLKAAFEAAHALKGVLGNLSLTPLYTPVVEITELLRSNTDMDYKSLLDTILEKRDELGRLCAE